MELPHLTVSRTSFRDLAVTFGPLVLAVLVALWIAFHFVRPAPPHTIVMTSGAAGSSVQFNAEKYRAVLAKQGVTLKALPSQGSLDNLTRLADPNSSADLRSVHARLSAR